MVVQVKYIIIVATIVHEVIILYDLYHDLKYNIYYR